MAEGDPGNRRPPVGPPAAPERTQPGGPPFKGSRELPISPTWKEPDPLLAPVPPADRTAVTNLKSVMDLGEAPPERTVVRAVVIPPAAIGPTALMSPQEALPIVIPAPLPPDPEPEPVTILAPREKLLSAVPPADEVSSAGLTPIPYGGYGFESTNPGTSPGFVPPDPPERTSPGSVPLPAIAPKRTETPWSDLPSPSIPAEVTGETSTPGLTPVPDWPVVPDPTEQTRPQLPRALVRAAQSVPVEPEPTGPGLTPLPFEPEPGDATSPGRVPLGAERAPPTLPTVQRPLPRRDEEDERPTEDVRPGPAFIPRQAKLQRVSRGPSKRRSPLGLLFLLALVSVGAAAWKKYGEQWEPHLVKAYLRIERVVKRTPGMIPP